MPTNSRPRVSAMLSLVGGLVLAGTALAVAPAAAQSPNPLS